jgi:hypothetical protein
MSPAVKFLIGLAAVTAMGWIEHGPLGHGEAYLSAIETKAQAAVAKTELPVQVRMERDPMSRNALISGQADAFQREGQGSLKGINDIVQETDGVAGIRWADASQQEGGRAMPLLLETLIPVLLAYLLGLAAGWFFLGRPKREGYL